MMSEVPAGLSPEAELRYALIRMLVASSNCSPSAYIQTAERLLEYIETGDVPEMSGGALTRRLQAGTAQGSGYYTPINVAGATFFVEGDAGQTQHLRQEDQSRG